MSVSYHIYLYIKMYTKLCVYFDVKSKRSELKPDSELQQVLNTMFEHNRKEFKLGWRKLLDMQLHELYHMISTLVTK